ncbi:MAG: tsaE [Fusobacteriales bacterium]|jgi:tRNA threonylcarbamoyladenosine biosynthesis protein TsaE|nr:tsaE [Fusobacteriales bacterium]
MKKVLTFSEIDILVDKLSKIIKKNDVIALIGDLGTGKTTFVKRIAKNLGITENVKSPTFTYVMEYRDIEPPLFHFDVYRICDAEEIYEIGYEDYLHNGGIVIIEWANLIESELPEEYLRIELFHNDENSREVEIKYVGNEKREKEIIEYVNFSN